MESDFTFAVIDPLWVLLALGGVALVLAGLVLLGPAKRPGHGRAVLVAGLLVLGGLFVYGLLVSWLTPVTQAVQADRQPVVASVQGSRMTHNGQP